MTDVDRVYDGGEVDQCPGHLPAPVVKFIYDGGRAAAGFRGEAGDCVCRAIAIATGDPYADVYHALHEGIREFVATSKSRAAKRAARGGGRCGTTPRNGVYKQVYACYLIGLGWEWIPTMHIGTGCRVHLCADELPSGRLVVSVSRHLVAVVDGVIHDTCDCSRGGNRCVYGYWKQRSDAEK